MVVPYLTKHVQDKHSYGREKNEVPNERLRGSDGDMVGGEITREAALAAFTYLP